MLVEREREKDDLGLFEDPVVDRPVEISLDMVFGVGYSVLRFGAVPIAPPGSGQTWLRTIIGFWLSYLAGSDL